MQLIGLLLTAGLIFILKLLKVPYFCSAIPLGYILNKYFPIGNLELLGDLGILLLFFNIGLELSLKELNLLKKHIKKTMVLNITMIILLLIPSLLLAYYYNPHYSYTIAVFTAISVALSSTPISLNFLKATQETHSELGHSSLTLILSQDIIAMMLLIFLTNLKSGFSPMVIVKFIGNFFIFSISLIVFKPFIQKIFSFIGTQDEITKLTGYNSIVLLFAYISNLLGLSNELGVTTLGICLASSRDASNIEHYLSTLKDFFMGCFFVYIGTTINLNFIMKYWRYLIIATLIIVALKTLAVIIVTKRKNKLAKIFLYSNISEVAFILFKKAYEVKLIKSNLMQLFFSSVILSLIIFPFFLRLGRKLLNIDNTKRYDLLIFGGSQVSIALSKNFIKQGLSCLLVDRDPNQVRTMADMNFDAKIGVLNSAKFINSLQSYKLKCVIIASVESDYSVIKNFIMKCRNMNITIMIISNDLKIQHLCSIYGAICIGYNDSAMVNNISQVILQKLRGGYLQN